MISRSPRKHQTIALSKKTKRERQAVVYLLLFLAGMAAGALAFFIVMLQGYVPTTVLQAVEDVPVKQVPKPDMEEAYLTPNEFSRPETPLTTVNGIVIHYVANPGSSAMDNRNYFEGLKDSGATYASSNFIVGLTGEIVACVPVNEVAYCSNQRNDDTLSIECCHMDESGEFNDNTYQSLVYLTAWLCGQYNLTADRIIRHYDVTGKNCPKYYVEHENAWKQFKLDVEAYIAKKGKDPRATKE